MNKALHMPVYPHHPHRTWITPKGQVVTATKKSETVADEAEKVDYEVKVIDTGSEETIDAFPAIKINASGKNLHTRQIEDMYYDRLRWLDGTKPDIEQLKKNVNAGIWEIDIVIANEAIEATPEPATTNH